MKRLLLHAVTLLTLICAMTSNGHAQVTSSHSPETVGEAEDRCRALLAEGQRLRRDGLQLEDQERGRELVRQARLLCQARGVSAEARAEAMLAAATLLADREGMEEIEAVIELLRQAAPDSELLPAALIDYADTQLKLGFSENDDALKAESLLLAHESSTEAARIFGAESPEYVRSLTMLTAFYVTFDGDDEAKPHLNTGYEYALEAVRLGSELHGEDAPTTLSAKLMLRSALKRLGRFEEARLIDRDLEGKADRFDEGW